MRKKPLPNGTAERWLRAHVDHNAEACLVWPFSCSTPGYGQFMPAGAKKVRTAHRLMCELVHGAAPTSEHQAAHSCGNRRCVNPAHLSWKTRSENQLDRHKHGTGNTYGLKGKLTPLQVEHIRSMKGLETSVQTAARYDTTESNVRLIQDGVTWRLDRRRIKMPFTPDQVRMIRSIGRETTSREIAQMLGLKSESAVRNVRVGKYYQQVK